MGVGIRGIRILLRCVTVAALTAATLPILAASTASAQSPAEFYRGKTVELYIAYSVGGGYDLYARLLARHLGKHIPGNPTVVAKNMEGAGGVRLAHRLYPAAAGGATALGAPAPAAAPRGAVGTTGSADDPAKVPLLPPPH